MEQRAERRLRTARWVPRRLRPLSKNVAQVVRGLWLAMFLFALGATGFATYYLIDELRSVRPAYDRFGLDYDLVYEGGVSVSRLDDRSAKPLQGTVVAVDGEPVPPDIRGFELARRLNAVANPSVTLDLINQDGTEARIVEPARAGPPASLSGISRELRLAIRLNFALIGATVALLCSALLALRRPRDPVAMLFAFAFAMMAASGFPGLTMWMAYNLARVSDVLASSWFYFLLIAIAVFPDGIFVPRGSRWLLWLGPPLAVFVSWPSFDGMLQVVVACGSLLAVIASLILRYRRLPDGLGRQQIKYAFFGFFVGLLMMIVALIAVEILPENHSRAAELSRLFTASVFSLGVAIIPVGLFVGLLRFRLWEADKVISNSFGYLLVTLIVGGVWAASADLVKLAIASLLGVEHTAGATTIGAVIAAGLFTPTQTIVLGWTKRRFHTPGDRLAQLGEKLDEWKLIDTPVELGRRVLEAVDRAVHPGRAAIVLTNLDGEQRVAEFSASSAVLSDASQRIELRDTHGAVGALILGRRSDGNRYNREEMEGLREIAPRLADAFRTSRARFARESGMQAMIEQMQARIAQLEGGPKPSSA